MCVQLEWPAKAEAFTLKVSVVRSVCDCALYYVTEVYRRLNPEDMFDEQGQFRATQKVHFPFLSLSLSLALSLSLSLSLSPLGH